MLIQAALFFEAPEQIYERILRSLRPRSPLPSIEVRFRPYANANSRIRLEAGHLLVEISDLLENAPAPVQEALAHILVAKLIRRRPDRNQLEVYRRYLHRADVRSRLHDARLVRGRKLLRAAKGRHFDLTALFDEVNLTHFEGLIPQPRLGWSVRASRTALGHYDPSHNTIVVSSLLDSRDAPSIAVKFVLFHEMLHMRYPTEYRPTRRCVHTPEFKRAEREFPQYKQAKAELKRFVEGAVRTNG
jgi:hypothetical protein